MRALLSRIGFVAGSLALLAMGNCAADSLALPRPWEVNSKDERFLFKMVPAEYREQGDTFEVIRDSYGIAYERKGDELVELWRVEGWYTFKGYLSEDGRYFVRMGQWASDQVGHTDLAVAFYDRGKLIKEYLAKELLRDQGSVEETSSHYWWQPRLQTRATGIYGDTFHLVTIEKTVYTFDLGTGEIVKRGTDPGALNFTELRKQEIAQEKVGLDLLHISAIREDYEKNFIISDVQVDGKKIASVHFSAPEWRATLTPREPSPPPIVVVATFPIKEGKLKVSLTAPEIKAAIGKALAHLYFIRYLKEPPANPFILKITGDRMHWDTPRLQRLHRRLTGREIPAKELKFWAEIEYAPGMASTGTVFINLNTGEAIYADGWKSDNDAALIDAQGQRAKPKVYPAKD
jgi:hypothetical protein